MKNLKHLFFVFALILSAGSAPASEESYSAKTALWAELAFKHALIESIDTLFEVNTALGIPTNSPARMRVVIPAAVGVLAVSFPGVFLLQKSVKILTPNNKMTPYLTEYKSIISSMDELKKSRSLALEKLNSLETEFTQPKTKAPPAPNQNNTQISAESKTALPSQALNEQAGAEEKNPTAQNKNQTSARKTPSSFNTRFNEAMLEIKNHDLKIEELYQKSLNHIQTKPGLLYRTGRLLRGAGLGFVIIGGITLNSFVLGDSIIILFDREDQLLETRDALKKDIFKIAGRLNVSAGIELN